MADEGGKVDDPEKKHSPSPGPHRETTNVRRFTRDTPCPICGGFEQALRKKGVRCHGFLSSNGDFAHCSREECASGLARVALEQEIPVAFGVLTTDTIEQAIERSGTKAGNKGADVAMSALEMVSLFRNL